MTTSLLEVQPRVQDIQAGRPYRLVGIQLPPGYIDRPTYTLEFTSTDGYGETVLMAVPDEPMAAFDLTGQMTSQLGTLLAAAGPRGFDNAGGATAVGWYNIIGKGTQISTTETVEILCGHGPVLVRLNERLLRKDRILMGQGSCGCAGGTAACGCGGGGACASCDHDLPPLKDYCNVMTERAQVLGRWRGAYSDLDPPDQLGPYTRYDVVEMPDMRRYVYVGPADGVTPCWAPGQTVGVSPH